LDVREGSGLSELKGVNHQDENDFMLTIKRFEIRMTPKMKSGETMRKTFLTWLLVFMTLAFILAFSISYFIQSGQAYKNAEKLIYLKIDDVVKQIKINQKNLREIRRESDSNALAKARSLAKMLEMNPAILHDDRQLDKIRALLEVDEIHFSDGKGILISGTKKDYYGYDFASDQQSAAFLPALRDKRFELAQDPQPKGINKEIFQYVGVARQDAAGIVQIGYVPEKLERAMEVVDIKNLAPGFRIGNSGSILIALQSGKIVSIAESEYLGKTIAEYGLPQKKMPTESGSFITKYGGREALIAYKTWGKYRIIGRLPTNEMYLSRDSSITVLILFNVLLFAVIFLLVAKLVQNVVINGIYRVNGSLAQITRGNLNEKVEVNTNEEFTALSQGINETVDALKAAIKEAAARIDGELAFARAIQLSVLPSHFPAFPDRSDFDIYAGMRPAKEVGGDFYDFFLINEDKLAVVVADVSGKGIPAALFMMISKTLIKNLTLSHRNLVDVFEKANNSLCENNDAGMFVTAFLGVLDLKSGKLTYVNAGHNPPLIKREGGDFERLPVKRNFVLAGMEDLDFAGQEINLGAGDCLFLYTDGVTEAFNKEGELFSESRLMGHLNRNAVNTGLRALDIVESVKQAVDAFAEGAEQADDITMLCLKYVEEGL
jgi:serine phosphatase RsbU (regulator of sigma subunit)